MTYQEKLRKLEQIIENYGHMVVALSGGVDSVFLLLFAARVRGGSNLTAITASAPNFAPDEVAYAEELCRAHGIPHMSVNLESHIMEVLKPNGPDRCYHCKKAIFGQLLETSAGISPDAVLCDGTNLDDMQDYRPGRKALEELAISSPLKEAGLTKAEIRQGLKDLGGQIWNKPAFACLASRIPYGQQITAEALASVYQAETALRQLGFSQLRVRSHGSLARIEVLPDQLTRFLDPALMAQVTAICKDAGFLYVTLDLEGYRMGSLNDEVLK